MKSLPSIGLVGLERRAPQAKGVLAMKPAAVGMLLLAVGCWMQPDARAADGMPASKRSGGIVIADAYARAGPNPCSWNFGNAGQQRIVVFENGQLRLASLKNTLLSPAKELIQDPATSVDFRLTWDGQALHGGTPGWECSTGTAAEVRVGGERAIRIDLVLRRSSLQVTRHYVVFPLESVIREWSTYRNLGPAPHLLVRPGFLDLHALAGDVAGESVTLTYMSGALCCSLDAFTLHARTLDADYARRFDSYDQPWCVDSQDAAAKCVVTAFQQTSSSYMPWFSLHERASQAGLAIGFDYFGRWQAAVGAFDGAGAVALSLPNFETELAPGAQIDTPQAFVATYREDLDDMSNRLLSWQYRYLWDFTRAGYFPGVPAAGNWCPGTRWCGNWDADGVRQKAFSMADRHREIGFDVHWTDNGWWAVAGDWNGPDFRMTNDYLAKHGMQSIIYYPAYGADRGAAVAQRHPEWFPTRAEGYTQLQGDMGNPAFAQWMTQTLVDNARRWGDYAWRPDSQSTSRAGGAAQLAQDQAYRRILRDFLTSRPGAAFFSVNSGGNELGFDLVRLSSKAQHSDLAEPRFAANAAYLFPIDKLSAAPDALSRMGYCSPRLWFTLVGNLSFYMSQERSGYGNGDTIDPELIECARKLVDTYHYLQYRGVVGRWVRQYHPSASDGAGNWFQRTSADGGVAVLHRYGADTRQATTVYPKGLKPGLDYLIAAEFSALHGVKTGAQLMRQGLSLPSAIQGETIYLNLPNRPRSGSDKTAPAAPTAVSARVGTNVNYVGIEITWEGGSDDNWVSYYNIYRDREKIGRVSKGKFYFDYSPAASLGAVYAVQTVDGDGNVSATATAPARGPLDTVIDDAELDRYGYAVERRPGAYRGTLSASVMQYPYTRNRLSRRIRGSAATLFAKLGPDAGCALVSIDGQPEAFVDLYAPDDLNYQMPVYTRAWSTVEEREISIVASSRRPDGGARCSVAGHAKPLDTVVAIDALRVMTLQPTVMEDADLPASSYTGPWNRIENSESDSGGTVSVTAASAASAEYRFRGDRVRVIGRYCDACGEADVFVDGKLDARIDTWGNRGNFAAQTVLFERSFENPGPHVIKIVATGTRNVSSGGASLYLDAIHTFRAQEGAR